jgi:hypothetical protein
MGLIRSAFFAAALIAAGSAHAFGIGARIGTTGVGADVAWNFAPMLDARIGYSTLSWSRDVTTEGLRYDGRLKLGSLSGLVDFAPFGPFLRLTGGLTYNDNRYEVRGTPPGGGALHGRVEAGRDLAPYLGIGFGRVAGAGVNFYSDFGVVFQGSPRARLNADCTGLGPAACASLQAQAATEQQRLEDELRRFRYYPVLNIGLTIGF